MIAPWAASPISHRLPRPSVALAQLTTKTDAWRLPRKTAEDFDAYLAKAFSGATPAERQQALERARPETRASLERAYAVRADFGAWDEFDPIANALVELTAAQNAVTAAINEGVYKNADGDIHAAAVARVEAIIGLLEAVIEEADAPSGSTKIDQANMTRLTTTMAAITMTAVVKRLNTIAAE
jgi:hypothetical protein